MKRDVKKLSKENLGLKEEVKDLHGKLIKKTGLIKKKNIQISKLKVIKEKHLILEDI